MKITYLAKLGELTLKGSNINAFESKLVRNVRDFLKHIPVDIILRAGRMYIDVEEENCREVEFCLSHLIGITGWAKTTICEKKHRFDNIYSYRAWKNRKRSRCQNI